MSQYYQRYVKYTASIGQKITNHSLQQEVESQQKVVKKSSLSETGCYNPQFNLRANVIVALQTVLHGQSLAQLLPEWLPHIPTQDKGLFHELLLGSLRQWFALKSTVLPLLEQESQEKILESCLYVGAYQILCTNIAHHAILSETVEAIKQLGYLYFSGVVNAVLRKLSREKEAYQIQLQRAHGLPSWLFKRLKKDWGQQVDTLAYTLKQHPPLTLRVNQKQISRKSYQQRLNELGIECTPCQYAKQGLTLTHRQHIPQLLGYTEGWFSVQDEHAQLCGDICAELLPNFTDKVVIDACTAPGGKLTHFLENHRVKHIFAIDNDAQRLKKVQENLQRLQLDSSHLTLITADATTWQSAQLADCILLDVPCSATGVIRRHPDIRLLRQPQDIANLVELQRAILEQMWQQLKVSGVLLYMTCSLLKAENEQQMLDFFACHADAKERPLKVNWGIAQRHGRQLLPTINGGDGFYYCLIEKCGINHNVIYENFHENDDG